MRKRLSLFILLFAITSVAGLKAVAASTDCDKWLKQYQDELANAAPVQHLKKHVHHLAHLVKPHPRVAVAAIPPVHRPIVPKLTPAEMLRRFHVLCDTPTEEAEITPTESPAFLVPAIVTPPPVEIATAAIPPLPGVPVTSTTPVTPVSPIIPPPPVGAPGLPIIPPPGQPGQPTQPITPVTPPVPEPSSIVLMLTGVAGIATRAFRK